MGFWPTTDASSTFRKFPRPYGIVADLLSDSALLICPTPSCPHQLSSCFVDYFIDSASFLSTPRLDAVMRLLPRRCRDTAVVPKGCCPPRCVGNRYHDFFFSLFSSPPLPPLYSPALSKHFLTFDPSPYARICRPMKRVAVILSEVQMCQNSPLPFPSLPLVPSERPPLRPRRLLA